MMMIMVLHYEFSPVSLFSFYLVNLEIEMLFVQCIVDVFIFKEGIHQVNLWV